MQSPLPPAAPTAPNPENTVPVLDTAESVAPQQKVSPSQLKIIVLVVITFLLVALGAYYLGTRNSKAIPLVLPSPTPTITTVLPTATPLPSSTPAATPQPTPVASATPAPLTYSNTQYGFSLTLPEAWSSYKVSTNPGPDPISINIMVPSPNANALPVGTLNIYLFTKSEWAAHPKKPQFITETNDYIFATDHYITARDECVQLDDFQCDRALEVPSVIETFSLE